MFLACVASIFVVWITRQARINATPTEIGYSVFTKSNQPLKQTKKLQQQNNKAKMESNCSWLSLICTQLNEKETHTDCKPHTHL